TRQVCCSLTTFLSNQYQRGCANSTSTVKYSGTPFSAAVRNSGLNSNSTSASIYSFSSRIWGSTLTTLSPDVATGTMVLAELSAQLKISRKDRKTRHIVINRKKDKVRALIVTSQTGRVNKP